jgi:hypothetical protein
MLLVRAPRRSADDAAQRIRATNAIASSLYSRTAKMALVSATGA